MSRQAAGIFPQRGMPPQPGTAHNDRRARGVWSANGCCHVWLLPRLVAAAFGCCHVWTLPHLDAAAFGHCRVWMLPRLDTAAFGCCRVWLLPSLVAADFGCCRVWLLGISCALCGRARMPARNLIGKCPVIKGFWWLRIGNPTAVLLYRLFARPLVEERHGVNVESKHLSNLG